MKKFILIICAGLLSFFLFGYYFKSHEKTKPVDSRKMVVTPAPEITDGVHTKLPIPKNSSLVKLVDKSYPIKERVMPDMPSRFSSVNDPDDISALIYVLKDASDSDTVRNEVANLLARSKIAFLPNILIEILENPQEKFRFRAFATQHLGAALPMEGREPRYAVSALQQEQIVQKLQKLLSDKDVEVRREAMLGLVRHKDPTAIQIAKIWLRTENDEGDKVRDLAIRSVYEAQLKECIPDIRKYARHQNEVVRIAAIVALSQWQDAESIPFFEEAAKSNSIRLQRAGKSALEKVGPTRL